MKSNTRRILGLLLASLMLLGVFGVCAGAEDIKIEDCYGEECTENGLVHDGAVDKDGVPVNSSMVLIKDYKCTDGLKEFYTLYYCKACGKAMKKVYTENGQPKQQPHDYVDVPGKAFSCTEDGLENGIVCSVCGKVKQEQKVIPAHHVDDADNDGYCDVCKAEMRYHCPYCNEEHAGFFGGFVKFFHNILANFGLKK